MESKNGIENAIVNLIQLSSEKGFLVFDDIYNAADKWSLSITDVDYLSSSITNRGILIYDEAPVTDTDYSSDDDFNDFAQKNYDIVFAKVIELDPGLENFITTVRNIVPPQAKEMDRLKYQVQEGNLYARERVIQMHLRLAVGIALQRAEAYDCEIADVLQDACEGLITAVDRYNPDYSGPFGPYASLWILQRIGRSQGTQRPSVYYPVHKRENYFAMYPVLKDKGYLDSERIWTDQKVRDFVQSKLHCNDDDVEDIIRQSMPLDSFEEVIEKILVTIESDNQQECALFKRFLEVFSCKNDPCIIVEQKRMRIHLEEMMSDLTSREQEVIRARYGFDDNIERTLEEIGRSINVTRERIRQIEAKAIRKLQHPTRMKNIKDFY